MPAACSRTFPHLAADGAARQRARLPPRRKRSGSRPCRTASSSPPVSTAPALASRTSRPRSSTRTTAAGRPAGGRRPGRRDGQLCRAASAPPRLRLRRLLRRCPAADLLETAPTLDDLATRAAPAGKTALPRPQALPAVAAAPRRAGRAPHRRGGRPAGGLGFLPPAEDSDPTLRILLPASEPAAPGDDVRPVTDARNWRSGVHGGHRLVRVRAIARAVPRSGAAA